MSQPDYIDILRMAKSMGIEPSPDEPRVPPTYEYSKEEIHKMENELEMCRMIIQHFDNEFRKMQQSLIQVNKNMQEIARYRLSWMTGWEDEVVA
ncbi:MAG: hypothetical protein ACPF9I_06405 [Candidatus Thalassarchaeaceae archaeon]